jgi:hypothetical protein
MTMELKGPKHIDKPKTSQVPNPVPQGASTKATFAFHNGSGVAFADLEIETGPAGAPTISKVTTGLLSETGEKKNRTPHSGNDARGWHILITIPVCTNFFVELNFSGPFTDRQWIEFSPTDDSGATIHGDEGV